MNDFANKPKSLNKKSYNRTFKHEKTRMKKVKRDLFIDAVVSNELSKEEAEAMVGR